MKKVRIKEASFFFALLALVGYSISLWEGEVVDVEVGVYSIALICICHVTFLLFSAIRYYMLFGIHLANRLNFLEWLRIFLEGNILNRVVPQGGNLYRGLELKRAAGFSHAKYVVAMLFIAWIDVFLSLVLALGCLIYRGEEGIYLILSSLILLVVGSVSALFTLQKFGRHFFVGNGRFALFASAVGKSWASISIKENYYVMFGVVLLGVVGAMVMTARIAVAFNEFQVAIPVADAFFLYAVYRVTTLVMLVPGNLGVQEASFGAISEILGYEFSVGFLVSVFLRLCGYAVFLVLWLSLMVKRSLSIGKPQ